MATAVPARLAVSPNGTAELRLGLRLRGPVPVVSGGNIDVARLVLILEGKVPP
jgi:hypothetical protein